MQQLKTFWCGLDVYVRRAREIAARPVKAVNESRQYRVASDRKTIGIVVVAGFSASAAGVVAATITFT